MTSARRRRLLCVQEDLLPGTLHRLQIREAVLHLPGQGLTEERHEAVPDGRLEGVGHKLRVRPLLRIRLPGRDRAVTPAGQLVRRHFVQCHGQRIAFGVSVVRAARDDPYEGVEIALGACLDLLRRISGEREVDQHQLSGAVGADPDRDVVRLQVPVPDPLRLEVFHRAEQVLPVRLQLVHAQAAVVPQLAGDGVLTAARSLGRTAVLVLQLPTVAHVLQDQDPAPGQRQRLRLVQRDDAGIPVDTAQDLRLPIQDRVLGLAQRNLQHRHRQSAATPRLALQVPHQECPRGRARTEPAHDLPSPGQHIPGHRLQRIFLRLGPLLATGWGRTTVPACTCSRIPAARDLLDERLLDVLQHFQEIVDRGQTPTGFVRSGRFHQIVDVRMETVDQRARTQTLAGLQACHDLALARARRLPGDQQIGENAEPVYIEAHRIGLRDLQLRRQIRIGLLRDM